MRVIAAAIFLALASPAIAADAAPPAPTPQKVCTFPDTAVIALNVNRGEVDAMLALIREPDNTTLGQMRILRETVDLQLKVLQEKYCK